MIEHALDAEPSLLLRTLLQVTGKFPGSYELPLPGPPESRTLSPEALACPPTAREARQTSGRDWLALKGRSTARVACAKTKAGHVTSRVIDEGSARRVSIFYAHTKFTSRNLGSINLPRVLYQKLHGSMGAVVSSFL